MWKQLNFKRTEKTADFRYSQLRDQGDEKSRQSKPWTCGHLITDPKPWKLSGETQIIKAK